ncbi:MAG TPA: DUF4265 domain-containing protein [Chloroflexia bacterium]|nr:DUF4265 domain-containing protein [Chloroflexia bacterium]
MTTEPARVFFKFKMPGDHPEPKIGVEGLWAEKIDADLYRLLNIPFVARGFAWGDVVRCEEVQARLVATETVQDSGNSTIRLLFRDPNCEEAERTVNYLQYLGCSFESNRNLFAFDVPPEPQLKISLRELAAYLNEISGLSDNMDWETGKWLSPADPATAK